MNTKKFKKGQTVWSVLNIDFTINEDIQILKGIVKSRKVITDPYSKTKEVYGIEDADGKGHMRDADEVFGSLEELKEDVVGAILDTLESIDRSREGYKKDLAQATKHFFQWKGLLKRWRETCAKEAKNETT